MRLDASLQDSSARAQAAEDRLLSQQAEAREEKLQASHRIESLEEEVARMRAQEAASRVALQAERAEHATAPSPVKQLLELGLVGQELTKSRAEITSLCEINARAEGQLGQARIEASALSAQVARLGEFETEVHELRAVRESLEKELKETRTGLENSRQQCWLDGNERAALKKELDEANFKLKVSGWTGEARALAGPRVKALEDEVAR